MLSDTDKSFMKDFGSYRTFGQQINYNSQAYCLDYQRYSDKYYTEHSTEGAKEISVETLNFSEAVKHSKTMARRSDCFA